MPDLKDKLVDAINVSMEDAEKIINKAEFGGEITDTFTGEEWFEQRFLPNCVHVDQEGYARMCVDALKILFTTAATDYGSSRQRDYGQLWADMTRGYLGEYAFLVYLKEKYGVEADLGHELGSLKDYLPMDIHKIKKSGEEREPLLKLGIKATKWNGIWFDIPGDQFSHSDIHVLVKVGAGRGHLLAFFKQISVFKDKVLSWGKDVGSLTNGEADELFDRLPTFKPIPAYICGFVRKTDTYSRLDYTGKKGRKHFNIKSWNGPVNPGDIDIIKEREALPSDGKAKFEGIGSFSHDKGYLFNTGNLLWKREQWDDLIDRM